MRPILQKQIIVYYDMTKALSPYINKHIKFYQMPHVFRIRRVFGKAVMQYKLFSTNMQYLPLEPENIIVGIDNEKEIIMAKQNHVNNIAVSTFSTVDGDETFYRHLGLNDCSPKKQVTEDLITEKIDNIKSMLPVILSIEKKAIDQQKQRYVDEEERGSGLKRYQSHKHDLSDIQQFMIQSSDKQ